MIMTTSQLGGGLDMHFLWAAGVLALVGWLVKYRQATWLISGYNTASKETRATYDTGKLTRYFGNFMFVLAVPFLMLAVLSVAPSPYADAITTAGFAMVAVLIVGGLVYLNTGNRLRKT